MKKLAIFDLDGTLLYTLEDLHASTNFALESEGLPARSLDEVRCFVGNGIRKLIERAVPPGTSPALTAEVLEWYKRYYNGHSSIFTCYEKDTYRPDGARDVRLTVRLRAAGDGGAGHRRGITLVYGGFP